ncbi:MAG: methyltransferase domain-containing protein [bacterium]|nr:methyltransferase domain-containing protein [bacterium]
MANDRIRQWLRERIGVDPCALGEDAIDRAINRRLHETGLSPEAYYSTLQAGSDERQALIESVIVPETWFFRERGAFAALTEWALSRWEHIERFRVLSLPCSSGEEAYSIAIALKEAGWKRGQVEIHGIDISERSIEKARRGVYRSNSIREDFHHRERYLHPRSHEFEIDHELKSWVDFRQANLFGDPEPVKSGWYDVIFCRNLMIYLNENARRRAIDRLERWIKPDGLLLMGAVELLSSITDRFEPVGSNWPSAYRRTRSVEASKAAAPSPSAPPPHSLLNTRTESAKTRNSNFRYIEPTRGESQLTGSMDVQTDTLIQAQRLANEGNLGEALEIVSRLITVEPRPRAAAFYLRGVIEQALDHPRLAEESYRKTLFLDPAHEGALAQLALLRERGGDGPGAARLRKRLTRTPQTQGEPS